MRSYVHWAAALGLAASISVGAASPVQAQSTGTLRGRVVDATNQRPLAGAQVAVSGTTIVGSTGLNGDFTLLNVPAGERTITVRRIGYAPGSQTGTIIAGAEARADFALGVSAIQLDKVVVTGTGLGAEARTIGNSVTTVNVAELSEKASVLNLSEILQGKSPGVTILPGSGTPGTAGEIRIRGASSISGYKPVVYIDGIRFNTESLGNFAPTGFGASGLAQSAQVTSALDFINPNDIESIEILKGPAAATLYGAEAANGVIQIITKKGSRGQQELRWTTRVDRGTTEWHLDTPVNYTTCDAARKAALVTGTTDLLWPGCEPVAVNDVITDEPMRRDRNAIRDGTMQRVSLSLSGGGDRYSFYVGGDRDNDQGVFYNSYSDKMSVRGNFSFTATEKLDFSVLVNYAQTDLRLPIGDESPAGILLSAARGRPGLRVADAIGMGWSTINPLRSNAYNNRTEADRLTFGGTVNYTPYTWFRNRLTIGLDNTVSQATLLFLPGDEGEPGGASLGQNPITRILSIDYGGSIPYSLRPELEFTTSFGAQVVANQTETLVAEGRGLGAPDVTLIGTAATTTGRNTFTENNSVGYYVQEQFGWRNRMFLTGALRADDHSSFGTNFDIILYPKLSASWVMSDEPSLSGVFDAARVSSFRLRSAWGAAGRAPSAYSATQTYTVDKVTFSNSTGSALRVSAYGNPDLRAEKGQEIEVGFDAALLDERVGVDFTFYNKKTTDMLVSIATAPSSGFPVSRLSNLGAVSNRGIELGLDATPVVMDNVEWNSRLTVATNRNRLLDFGVEKVSESPTGQAYGVVQQHREGYPLGGYWAQKAKRNPDTSPQVVAGAVVLDTAEYIGPSAPTREVGWSNTITLFRNFRLYGLLDYKGGHFLFNLKERNRCQTANDNCKVVNDPRARFPLTAQDTLLNKELLVWRSVPSAFIEKADFIKLREISLTYTVPRALVQRLGPSSAAFTIAGRNLGLWTDYSGLDPEVSSYGGRNFVRVDAYAAPMTRRLVGTVNLTF
jgi:TonB-dependent starch-binding outer membrane protein SusC